MHYFADFFSLNFFADFQDSKQGSIKKERLGMVVAAQKGFTEILLLRETEELCVDVKLGI